jgi:hypothetical protein
VNGDVRQNFVCPDAFGIKLIFSDVNLKKALFFFKDKLIENVAPVSLGVYDRSDGFTSAFPFSPEPLRM